MQKAGFLTTRLIGEVRAEVSAINYAIFCDFGSNKFPVPLRNRLRTLIVALPNQSIYLYSLATYRNQVIEAFSKLYNCQANTL